MLEGQWTNFSLGIKFKAGVPHPFYTKVQLKTKRYSVWTVLLKIKNYTAAIISAIFAVYLDFGTWPLEILAQFSGPRCSNPLSELILTGEEGCLRSCEVKAHSLYVASETSMCCFTRLSERKWNSLGMVEDRVCFFGGWPFKEKDG